MSSELIFVTGANGYLGGHIIHKLLQKGYRVRGTARSSKIDHVKSTFASYGNKFQAVEVNDVANDNITPLLQDVDAVIHSAAPLPGKGDANFILKGAIEGTLNIFRLAEKVGIRKMIYTSTIGTAWGPAGPPLVSSAEDWNPVTKEQALEGDPSDGMNIYLSAKVLAEREVWKFADGHKNVDVTVLNPPFLYGPYVSGAVIPSVDDIALSTAIYIYRLLFTDGQYPSFPGYADVRDVARIHVEALNSPPESSVGRKRILISSPHDLEFKAAVELIATKRPELKSRLVDVSKAPKYGMYRMAVDWKRIEEVTGVKEDSYIPVADTILDTVDNFITLEDAWISAGQVIGVPK